MDKRDGLQGRDKQQGDLRDSNRVLPEGAVRDRKGPLDKDEGRRREREQNPGQPAGGE
jgi:hypothetical protein